MNESTPIDVVGTNNPRAIAEHLTTDIDALTAVVADHASMLGFVEELAYCLSERERTDGAAYIVREARSLAQRIAWAS